jgi:hypothetical protein
MRAAVLSSLATGVAVFAATYFLLPRREAPPPAENKPAGARAADKPPEPTVRTPEDLTFVADLVRHFRYQPYEHPRSKTRLTVGGRNDTAVVRALAEINGRPIAELEKDMRPGAAHPVGSTAGFLGKDEKLLDVLAADNDYVLVELGLSHQELATELHALGAVAVWRHWKRKEGEPFVYRGRRFETAARVTKGSQPSPFLDGTESGTDVTVTNCDTGEKITYGLLVPFMIERYGFYEGKGTPYRVEPAQVVEVLDYIRTRKRP